ncbi:hypothetical protein GCM10010103_66410 [Streptomyces paradoxus]
MCEDACLTLRNAYGQLGVQAELLPVDLAVHHKDGGGTLYGSLTPSWTGASWNGQCVLVLPAHAIHVQRCPRNRGLGGRDRPQSWSLQG